MVLLIKRLFLMLNFLWINHILNAALSLQIFLVSNWELIIFRDFLIFGFLEFFNNRLQLALGN